MFDNSQFFSGAKGFYPLTIDQSLRFNDDDSAYLSWTPASAGNRKTWTISGWVKKCQTGQFVTLLQANHPSSPWFVCGFDNGDKLEFTATAGASASWVSTSVYRDPSAWYHLVFAVDTTSATTTMNGSSTDRIRAYVNGEQVVLTGGSVPSQNSDLQVSNTVSHTLGAYNLAGKFCDQYLANVHFIDGQALTASDFGETKNGVWVAKDYAGTFGTNGFYLDFANSADIGNDVSGEGNDWTPNNFTASDVVLDSPTDNYCTLNPLSTSSNLTLSDGNLRLVLDTGGEGNAFSTFALPSGKWYFEIQVASTGSNGVIGIANSTFASSSRQGLLLNTSNDIFKSINGSSTDTGVNYSSGDVFGFAFDIDAKDIEVFRNGSSLFSDTYSTDAEYFAGVRDSSTPNTGTFTFNFGQLGFTYTPPTGYLALSTANLPDPVIDPAQGASPEDYFEAVAYSGTSDLQLTVPVSFQPDFSWIKVRNQAYSHQLADAVRGGGEMLFTNGTGAESTNDSKIYGWNTSGVIVGNGSSVDASVNGSGNTYVAWNWKANGSGVSNTDGSITSTVSANTTSGFSIVGYTGNGTAGATVGHGLSSVPEMIIVKNRDATDAWQVYHASNTANPETDYLVLNTTAATADNLNRWNDTAPTTSVFSLGDGVEVNTNTEDYIAYAFHSVEGFSKFGSYVGNGSADGPFVYTGFRPAFVMFKNSQATSDWWIYDAKRNTYNVMNSALRANVSDAELSYTFIDTLSNGFKLRNTGGDGNGSGATIIYMAFAENPFKYSNAR